MSWMLEWRLSLPLELRRMMYFCAWLANYVGVEANVPPVPGSSTLSHQEILHNLLQKFTTSMSNYIKNQADNGAHAIQIFDSWATEFSLADFEFSLPYPRHIVDSVRETHPNLPLILYASGSGGLLERLPLTGVDVVSLDWTVDMAEGRKRLGSNVAVQGNVDPGVLFGSKEFISKRIYDTVQKAGNVGHVLNLAMASRLELQRKMLLTSLRLQKGSDTKEPWFLPFSIRRQL